MTDAYHSTKLWKNTLSVQNGNDPDALYREKLRGSYLDMRDAAQSLVSLIPQDCKGLTVHDVTHLDALWEMADLLSGNDPSFLNPAEAYVFGGAILLHDAAMSVAAFPGGIEELERKEIWPDTVHAAFLSRRLQTPDRISFKDLPLEIGREVIFSVIRSYHAEQAKVLSSKPWIVPHTKEQRFFIDNSSLRASFSHSIGLIAYSHHWDIDSIERNLSPNRGAAADFPLLWTIDEVKIACLLRCADIMHIDARRAPRFLYAILQPQGVSDEHWGFQSKINKPTILHDSLIYSSGESFGKDQVAEWWRCYDAISAIDKELSQSNSLLREITKKTFQVSKVEGANSPVQLSKHIRVADWKPVNAELRVTNPSHLASTLGGASLYGSGPFVPIRELLQNAIDAVRHRIADGLEHENGQITVTLEQDEKFGLKLSVDDNGIGMSERVLVGPLLDFGRSFWNTQLMRDEHPGLQSKGVKSIGKFGIGFFSIFLLGDHVKVISKKYDEGKNDINALEFSTLVRRPILMRAAKSDLPLNVNTRVSVYINKTFSYPKEDKFRSFVGQRFSHDFQWMGVDVHSSGKNLISEIMSNWMVRLITPLDIRLTLIDKISDKKITHNFCWKTSSNRAFIEKIFSTRALPNKLNADFLEIYAEMLDYLYDDDGNIVGRAALDLDLSSSRPASADLSYLNVGGLLYETRSGLGYIGVMNGDTNEASRFTAFRTVSDKNIGEWATRQASKIARYRFSQSELIYLSYKIRAAEGDSGDLPVAKIGNNYVNISELRKFIKESEKINFLLERRSYAEVFDLPGVDELGSRHFLLQLKENIVTPLKTQVQDVIPDSQKTSYSDQKSANVTAVTIGKIKENRYLSLVIEDIEREFGPSLQIYLERLQIFSDEYLNIRPPEWVLSIHRTPKV
jgi:hypothetical protein